MNMTGNTILVTGGGSGIGRALAEAFHAAGNRVIIAGRRAGPLQEVAAANPGMATAVLDVGDPAGVPAFAAQAVRDHPALNVLVNNAGIMQFEDLLADPVDTAVAEAAVMTNLLGPMRLTSALLPHLRRQAAATVVNVSSGLAFVPLAAAPTYNATKAAIHSYTESLRHQLRATPVQVIELVPPLVATDLRPDTRADPRAMPLEDFIGEVMALLRANPGAKEICVERVGLQRKAEAEGRYQAVFDRVNPA